MILIDASTRWSTHNQTFVKLLAQLRAHFPYYPIKKICLNNIGEFASHAFYEYCISIGVEVKHLVTHVYTPNGLTESLIKCLKLVARSLLMRANLPMATC